MFQFPIFLCLQKATMMTGKGNLILNDLCKPLSINQNSFIHIYKYGRINKINHRISVNKTIIRYNGDVFLL